MGIPEFQTGVVGRVGRGSIFLHQPNAMQQPTKVHTQNPPQPIILPRAPNPSLPNSKIETDSRCT